MGKHYKFWKDYFFTCDGGINPPNHYPVNVTIREQHDGTCQIWPGSVMNREVHPTLEHAEKYLFDNYDSIYYTGHNLVTNYKPSEPILKK